MLIAMSPAKVRFDDNPFVTILVNALQKAGANVIDFKPRGMVNTPDVLHLHWLERVFWGRLSSRFRFAAMWNASRLVSAAKEVRLKGGRVVWTVHNIAPHDDIGQSRLAPWDKLITELLPLVSDVVVMSEGTEANIRIAYPQLQNASFHYIPHPHYGEFVASLPLYDVRPMLGVIDSTRLYCCVGKIRRYKQIPEMIEALRVHHVAPFKMVIAGGGDKAYASEISKAIGNDSRFFFDNRELSHVEVFSYLKAADAAVFNFKRILNSGSVLAALSVNTPVICPASGALLNLSYALGSECINTYEPPLLGSSFVDRLAGLKRPPADKAFDLSSMTPEIVGQCYVRVYRGINNE